MKNKFLSVILGIAICACISYTIYLHYKINKIVVIDIVKVFNEFDMKKELERKVDVELSKSSAGIDSLNALLDIANKSNDGERADIIEQMLYEEKIKAQQTYEISNKNINEQVWKRLNPLVDEFSKQQGYGIVLGANGMGSILYNEDATDRTTELIYFINSKYQNGK